MKNNDTLQLRYEQLGKRYEQMGEQRRRDHCLVLAADAALAAGRPQEAERLRQWLLRVNPYHLLCPYASMSEAMNSGDVRDYIADLRQQLSPERVEQLLKEAPEPEAVYKVAHDNISPPTPHEITPLPEAPPRPPRIALPPPPARKPAPVPKAPTPTRQTASPTASLNAPRPLPGEHAQAAGRLVATFLFLLGLLLGGGVFFLAFIRPFFD
jgi:hypothetical protein